MVFRLSRSVVENVRLFCGVPSGGGRGCCVLWRFEGERIFRVASVAAGRVGGRLRLWVALRGARKASVGSVWV